MLKKGAIQKVSPAKHQFLSNSFTREKKDGGLRTIINLKKLNQNMEYLHFKMEGLKDLKNILKKGDLMVEIDLKDAY